MHQRRLFPKTQAISQLKKTQKVRFRQRETTIARCFATHPGMAWPVPCYSHQSGEYIKAAMDRLAERVTQELPRHEKSRGG